MQPITYTLDINDLHVLAVIAWDGQRGALLVSYDERCLSVKLGPQPEFLREDACRALTSRRCLAEMAPQLTYSRKATCRAVANRLDLLVEQGKVLESEAQCLLDSITARFNGLRTEHDFDRFIGVCTLDLERCRRNDEDFERVVAPALAEAIKADIKAGPRITAETTLTAMTSALKGFLQSQGFPVKAGDGLKEVFTGLGATVTRLRAQADASLQAGSCDAMLTKALERRGIAVPVGFGPALKVRALVEYLGAVEAAAEKWQVAGKRWQKFADGRLRLGWPCSRDRMLSPQPLEMPPGAVTVEKDETGLFTVTVEKATELGAEYVKWRDADDLMSGYLERFPEMKRYFGQGSAASTDSGDFAEGSLVVIRWPRVFEDRTNDGLVCTVVQVASCEDGDTYYDLCAGDKDLRVAGEFLFPAPAGAREGDVLERGKPVERAERWPDDQFFFRTTDYVEETQLGRTLLECFGGAACDTPVDAPAVVHKHDSEEPTC